MEEQRNGDRQRRSGGSAESAEVAALRRIVKRAASGETGALAELYERYAEHAFELAFGLTRSIDDAQDVVHDVFLGLPEALSGYDGGDFRSWIGKVAVRGALEALRGRRRKGEVALEPDLLPDAVADRPLGPGDRMDLERALGGLPETLRVVLVLKEIVGYSHDEIGELLGISAAASATRLMRARQQLRRALS